MESKQIEVDGIWMRWEEQGAGLPVIFLHGIPTGPALWRHVIPRVEGARALAWEMVGYGASIPQGERRDISLARQAAYLVAWIDRIGIASALLVGHDLGGGVAQIVAVEHPERVEGLVLLDAVCYDSWPIPALKRMRAMGALGEHVPDFLFEPIFRRFLLRGHDDPARGRESIEIHWQPYRVEGGAAALIRQSRALDVRDTLAIADRLSDLRLPARVVWGTSDPFQEIGYGYRLAHDLAARLERIEGGRHFVPEDHPEEVARTVNRLLQEVRENAPLM